MSARAISLATLTAISQSRKNQKPNTVCPKRLDFFGEFDCRNSVSCSWAASTKQRKKMTAFHANMSEEEAFTEGSFGAGGLQATLNNLSKWVVAILFSLIVLWRHDAEALWAFTGAVLNAMLSLKLKKIINQDRPISSTIRSDPGMPSSHAQYIFYIITFLNLSMIEWYGINGLTTTIIGLFSLLGSYFSWLRVSQQLHTVSQVIVGGVLGSIFSIFWFWSWNTLAINSFISSLTLGVIIFVVLGSIGFCVAFMYHVFQTWIMEEG